LNGVKEIGRDQYGRSLAENRTFGRNRTLDEEKGKTMLKGLRGG
jgi:hypothetical protein